jgi:integrase
MTNASDRCKPGPKTGTGFYYLPDAWPESDTKRWNIVKNSDMLRTTGRSRRQSRRMKNRPELFGREPGTLHQLEYAYGYLVAYLDLAAPETLALTIPERITFSVIVSFVSFLQMRTKCNDAGIANRLNYIYMVLLRLEPHTDWEWLFRIKKFHEKHVQRRDKSKHFQPINVLLTLGIRLMREAKVTLEQPCPEHGLRMSACRKYRNGLIIAVLSTTVLRRGNLADLRIDETVFPEENWRIEFSAHQMKTDAVHLSEIPEQLRSWAVYFLQYVRLLFPGAHDHNHLWPSKLGGPLSSSRVYSLICEETEAAFNVHTYPHLFRTAAATFVADTDPTNMGDAQETLGHVHVERTEIDYVMPSDAASLRHNDFLLGLGVEY